MSAGRSNTGTLGVRGSAERAHALHEFVEAYFAHYGATVSPVLVDDAPHLLRVELPPALAEHFRTASLTLTTSPRQREAEIVVPGSRVFDAMVAYSESLGTAAWVPLVARHPAPAALPEGAGPSGLLDGVPSVSNVLDVDLELAVRVVILADQRHEELALIYVPADGEPFELDASHVAELVDDDLVVPQDAASAPLAAGSDRRGEPPPDAQRSQDPTVKKRVKERLEAAFEWLRGWTRTAVAPREAANYEQLSREVQRLTHYFGELIAENELDDDLREQLAADLDRRIAEEVANHRLSVALELRAYAVVARPRTRFDFAFDVGGETIAASWRFDRAEGTLLGPRCGACDTAATQASACTVGALPHLVCAACGDTCEECGAGVCSEHGLVHCHVGGESLCSSCGPRCGGCGKPTRRSRLLLVDGEARCERCRPRR